MHKLFVYGTLRPFTGKCIGETIAPATIKAKLYIIGVYVPAVTEVDKTDTLVHGDLLLIDNSTLLQTDRYEHEGQVYRRIRTKATTENKLVMTCWVYEIISLQRFTVTLVPSGDWKEYMTRGR